MGLFRFFTIHKTSKASLSAGSLACFKINRSNACEKDSLRNTTHETAQSDQSLPNLLPAKR